MFIVFILLTGFVAARALILAYHRSRDMFHPLVITIPMILALYVLLPLKLFSEDALVGFFPEGDLQFVLLINLLGIICFCWGCLTASGRRRLPVANNFQMSAVFRKRVMLGGILLGMIGLLAYAVTIVNVGGLYQAYSQAYSGGWSDYGYIRDAVSLCIPALVFILMARAGQKLSWLQLILCLAFAAPFLIQGLLGARRGPTFLVCASAGLCWYMMRARRPRPAWFGTTGLCIGLLMLFLVSNREHIYLGSDWNFDKSIFEYLKVENTDQGSGNEFIYGGGSIVHSSLTGEYYWGRRYFAEIFIRPIPRQLWPNKYEAMGLGQLEENAGTGGNDFLATLGWSGAEGAAPGMIADLWVEFWWLALPVLYGIGWAYGFAWRQACLKGGFATVLYIFMASLSIFLVFQTMEAILVRLLFMSVSSVIVWRWSASGRSTEFEVAPAPEFSPLKTSRV